VTIETTTRSPSAATALFAAALRPIAAAADSRGYVPGKAAFAMLALYAIADLALVRAAALSISHATALVGSVAILLAAREIAIRRRLDAWMATACSVLCLVLAVSILGVLLSYALTALSPFRLHDPEVLAADRLLGFHWSGFVGALDRHPLLCQILGASYETMGLQMALLALIPALRGDRATADAVALTIGMALAATNLVAFLVPTVGVTTLEPHDFAHLTIAGGIDGQHDYLALREGTLRNVRFDMIAPLLTFPSFHAVVATTATLASRRIPYAFPVVLLLNALMFVSTLTHGGHYLLDVLAGAAIAFAAWRIALVLAGCRR
jgi:membrane-associated phospholipid phosphatase